MSGNKLFYPRYLPNVEQHSSKIHTAIRPGQRILTPEVAIGEQIDAYWSINLDPSMRQSIEVMAQNIVGKKWEVRPGPNPQKIDREKAKLQKEKLDNIKNLLQARMTMAKESRILGETYFYVKGERKRLNLGGYGFQNWWIPTEIEHIDRNRVKKITNDNGYGYEYHIYDYLNRKYEPLDPERKKALGYFSNSNEEGRFTFGNGLLDPAYVIHTFKNNLIQQYLHLSERYGQGNSVLSIDDSVEANMGSVDRSLDDLREDYEEQLANFDSSHVLIKRKTDEFEVKEAPSNGFQIIKDGIDYYDGLHRMLFIGSLLTVSQGDQGTGSYNLGLVHHEKEKNHARYPRTLQDNALTNCVVRLVDHLNAPQYAAIGLGEAKHGEFFTPEETNDDYRLNIERINTCLEHKQAIGKSTFYEMIGIPEPEEDEELVEPPIENIASPYDQTKEIDDQELLKMPKGSEVDQQLDTPQNSIEEKNENNDPAKRNEFAQTNSTIGMDRENMPQLNGSDFGAFLDKLISEDITITRKEVLPSQIKPTQEKTDDKKVEGMVDKMRKGVFDFRKPIIVSSDNFIFDGHHKWKASLLFAPNKPITIIQPELEIGELWLRATPAIPKENNPIVKNEIAEAATQFAQKTLLALKTDSSPEAKLLALEAIRFEEKWGEKCPA